MAVLLVLCDPEDAALVAGAITEYGKTFRLSGSDYLLSTDKHRDEIWSDLRRRPGLSMPDSLLLVPMQDPFRGAAHGEVQRWLKRVVDDHADHEI